MANLSFSWREYKICKIVFTVWLANSLGFKVDHELFKTHSAYVRNSLVWAFQGIYSKYECLEKIFFGAIFHEKEIPHE